MEAAVEGACGEKERPRFQRGVPDRGRSWLEPRHLADLERRTAGYPSIDLAGLELLRAGAGSRKAVVVVRTTGPLHFRRRDAGS